MSFELIETGRLRLAKRPLDRLQRLASEAGGVDRFALEGNPAQLALEDLPDLARLAEIVKQAVGPKTRPVLLRVPQFLEAGDATPLLVMLFGACLGELTPTDQVDRVVVWHVTPRASLHHDGLPTITERPGEAASHTDSSYKLSPESRVLFFVVRESKDGGGQTVIANGQKIFETLDTVPEGRDSYSLLSTKELPFRVPTSFTRLRREDTPEYVTARVINSENEVRYRLDRIMAGLALHHEPDGRETRAALECFDKAVKRAQLPPVPLTSGDLIVLDNRHWLHGRTHFTDERRHLLRVRIA